MLLLVPEVNRKFPLQEIPYLDMSQDDFFETMLALKRANCPNWTDESASDFGVQLLWLFSIMADWLVKHAERIKNNTYIGTTQNRESMRKLCELIGYSLSEMAPASVSVTFNYAAGHPEFTILKGTQVSTIKVGTSLPIIFEVSSDQLIGVGVTTSDISCTQGETVLDEVLGSSGGVSGMEITIPRTDVIKKSEIIEIYYNNTWNTWNYRDSFLASSPTDIYYILRISDNNEYIIKFGDGVNGMIPPIGVNNIKASYRIGIGARGNVGIATIIELATPNQYIDSVTNAIVASGGIDQESLEHARQFAPLSVKTNNRIVTAEDIEYLAENYTSSIHGGIAKAKAFETKGVIINVSIVPKYGGLPSDGLKTAVESELDASRMITTSIRVLDPTYLEIDITATINILEAYNPSEVAARVKNNLVSYISPYWQDPVTGLYPHSFGRNINISDLYRVMDSTDGVDYCNMSLPAADVSIIESKIANVGTINLTIVSPTGGTYSYADLGPEQ